MLRPDASFEAKTAVRPVPGRPPTRKIDIAFVRRLVAAGSKWSAFKAGQTVTTGM